MKYMVGQFLSNMCRKNIIFFSLKDFPTILSRFKKNRKQFIINSDGVEIVSMPLKIL